MVQCCTVVEMGKMGRFLRNAAVIGLLIGLLLAAVVFGGGPVVDNTGHTENGTCISPCSDSSGSRAEHTW